MSLILETVQSYLPAKRKQTPSGWISFDAVCCHHNGTSHDTRQRGGITVGEGVSYHCFNCGFKASWAPGRVISDKMKHLLRWLNVPDDVITKCVFEGMRLREFGPEAETRSLLPNFIDVKLPRSTKPISEYIQQEFIPNELVPIIEYIHSRGLTHDAYNFQWCEEAGFNDRLIIPFYYKGRLVGWTGRKVRDGKPKYLSEQQPGYVFNLDSQTADRKFVIIVEGPLDAISIDAVALTGSEINKAQHALINLLHRQVIVVPDRDQAGAKLIDQAIEFGWSVSMPNWPDGVKDVNDAVIKHGRLYALWKIVNSAESMALKIQLNSKNWLKGTT
jgi:hypothetical protein